jgi:uncharacterized membrane protein
MKGRTASLLFIGALLMLTIPVDSVTASENGKIEVTTPFPKVSIDAGRSLTHKITVRNNGDRGEVVDLSIVKPPEWSVRLEGGGYEVRSIYLPPGGEQYIDMFISLPATEENGTYNLQLLATNADNTVSESLSIAVEIRRTFEREIEVYCTTPEIEGPSTGTFEFQVNVANRGGPKTITYNLVYPEGWEASVQELYGDTVLRSQSFTAGESKNVKFVVNPPERADKGRYPVKLIATYGETHAEIQLTATLTGIYELSVTTQTGLVSTSATCGEETILAVAVTNEGTGVIGDISLSTPQEPSGWEVTFNPHIIPELAPGETQYSIMAIKPASDSLPGDYELEVGAYSGTPHYRSDTFTLRVSVSATTAWGYAGGFIIAATLLGFLLVFRRFGRR